MLVLQRDVDETVVITLEDGREIRVTVVPSAGRAVRLGFVAPRTIAIAREELVRLAEAEAA